MTVRWCDIFIFSNRPYPDVKRWHYTQNDTFNLMLKSDFDQRNKKNEKKDIFFHSLLFLTLKYKIFLGISFVYAFKKVWVNILSGAAMIERPDFLNEKKSSEKKHACNFYRQRTFAATGSAPLAPDSRLWIIRGSSLWFSTTMKMSIKPLLHNPLRKLKKSLRIVLSSSGSPMAMRR